MRRKTVTILLAFCLSMLMCVSTAVPAHANSAQTKFSGVDAMGTVMTDPESPIIVEHERLTFDIGMLPSDYYHTAEEFSAYDAKVTAQYTFCNPSSYTVTATLLFPFGNLPNYIGGYFDEQEEAFFPFDDTERYDITVDGEAIEKTVRHTFSDAGECDWERELASLSDGFVQDEFYTPGLTVTKYVFRVRGVDTEKYDAASIAFDVPKGSGASRIYFPMQNGAQLQQNGEMRISSFIREESDTFALYVFGAPFSEMPAWTVYEDGGTKDREQIAGGAELVTTETMTFEEFALSNHSTDSPVSETDWYNALVAELKESMRSDYPVVECPAHQNLFQGYLTRWYEYEITLSPEQRMVNEVTAPLYPFIDTTYTPSIFTYTYLLSPAKTWKSFGGLDIVVNTPYYVTDGNIDGMTRTEEGYQWTLTGLPDGEFSMTLSTSEHPIPPKADNVLPTEIIVVICVAAGAALIGVGVLIVVLLRRQKKRRREE